MLRITTVLTLIFFTSVLYAQDVSHQWTRTNPGGGGAFSTIAAGPTGIIIAGSDLSGAYRSLDGGGTWDVIGASKGLTVTHVSSMGFHPTDGNILYVGTEAGIFRSNDEGNTVSEVLGSGYITDIKFAPTNTAVGYASYHPTYDSNNGVIYKTTNNGFGWGQISTDLPAGLRILKLEVSQQDEDIVFLLSGAGRFACGPAEVYRSIDGGSHWTHIASGLGAVLDMVIDPVDDNSIYLTDMNAACLEDYYWTDILGTFYKSTDNGDNWTALSSRTGVIWLKPSTPNTIRLIDPRRPFPWNADEGTWQSIDDGLNWTKIGDGANWGYGFNGQAYFSYASSYNGITKTLGKSLQDEDVMYWVNSQWCFGTQDGGVVFNHLHTGEVGNNWWQSTGFANVNMMDIAISPANNDKVYLGYFDMGFWRSLDHGASWQSGNDETYAPSWIGLGGNVTSLEADPTREDVVWTTMSENQNGQDPCYLLRSNDAGEANSWVESDSGLPSVEIMGISIDPNSSSTNRTLYVTAEGDVYKSTNDGYNWTQVLNDGGCRFTAVDFFDGNLVYAGGESGLWRSENGGSSWNSVGNGEMTGSGYFWDDFEGVFDINTDPHLSGRAYVSFFGNNKGMYKSEDGGDSWTKLLTDNYMRSIAISPTNENVLYATSSSALEAGGYEVDSHGVLFSYDRGVNWTNVSGDMDWPFAAVVEVDASGQVFVGSPGTGFQVASVPSVLPVEIVSPFSGMKRNNKVLLEWSTAVEVNNKRFFIEKMDFQNHWKKWAEVKPKSSSSNYQVWDDNPIQGENVYRLWQEDFDGNLEMLGMESIYFDVKGKRFEVYPNPATHQIEVAFDKEILTKSMKVYLWNTLGQQMVLSKIKTNGNKIQLPLDGIPSGVYYMKIYDKSIYIGVRNFVVKE